VLERVVENWLTKVNERSLEIPFCQMLAGEGYQVVHLSRHGPFEEGKDILAIDPVGVPCAFQLKGASGGKITPRAWEEYLAQIIRLVEIPIAHPAIDPAAPRKVYLVTNGELDEEVRIEIDRRNGEWERRGYPRLDVIVKGQLLGRFRKLHTNFWPVQLEFERDLLEFFLTDGTACLDKGKLACFIESLLPFTNEKLNRAECDRLLASAALLTAYALSSFEAKNNYVAVIEGWMVYVASLAALVEAFSLENRYWQESLKIATLALEQNFAALSEELRDRDDLIEGNELVDGPFYRGRVTWLVGLVATWALWNKLRNPRWQIEDWIDAFVRQHKNELLLWGEGAIPSFLSVMWFLRHSTGSAEPDALLASLITSICAANEGQNTGLPDPYHSLVEVIEHQLGLARIVVSEHFKGRSYTLESLIQLFARRGLRQQLRFLWPRITHLQFAEFRVDPRWKWKYCFWYSDEGTLSTRQPKTPQSWADLIAESRLVNVKAIPDVFRRYPELLLIFLVVYPHRINTDVVKFLDDCIWNIR